MRRHLYNKLWMLPIGLYLFLSCLYLFAIPVGESPDEPGHLQCVEQVSQFNRVPLVEPKPQGEWWSRGVIVSGRMCYHMPLYYLVGGYLQRAIASSTQTSPHFELPPSNPQFSDNGNMFLHENKRSFWHLPESPAVIGLRLLSIALGMVTIWGGYTVSRHVFPKEPTLAILSATMVAGWPQFVYLSRSINNDALATALAVGVVMVLIQVGRPNRFVVAALLSALAVLTKISVAFTIVAVLSSWIVEIYILRAQKKQYMRALLFSIIIWSSTALIIRWHPTLYEHFIQGTGRFSSILNEARTIAYWQNVIDLTASSGWARLGWMNVPAPQWHANSWWFAIIIMSIIGMLVTLQRRKTLQMRLLLFILAIWTAGIFASYLRINLNRLQPQFRFALASLPIITTFSTAGISSIVRIRNRIDEDIVNITIIAFLALFLLSYNIWLVMVIVRPFYGYGG